VTGVDLGFMERDFDSWETQSKHFPSKIGGKPAWLDLTKLPLPKELQCPHCALPLTFLLQVYSPDNNCDSAFHRSLFIFLCVASPCWEQGKEPPVLVLRCQLGRSNPFYPWEPPEERDGWREDIKAEAHGKLCAVCGCRADKSCAQCKKANYCSEKHQRADWKAGHKSTCKGGRSNELASKSSLLLPEGLIESEPEPKKGGKDDTGQDINQYRDVMEGGGVTASPKELEEVEAGQEEDIACEKFRLRVARASDQVIRYERGGTPLLCTSSPALGAPPPCHLCKAPRIFELQVMPQLLFELKLGLDADSCLDWGSIYIYSCSASCEAEGYTKEFTQLRQFSRMNLPAT